MIYFIEAIGADAVKIGYSQIDPWKRLLNFQVGCPHELRLLRVADGDKVHEAALHKRWEAHWIRGEWHVLSAIQHELETIQPIELDTVLRRCLACKEPLRSKRPNRHYTGMCKRCAHANRKNERTCQRCGTQACSVKRYGGNAGSGINLCRPCIPIVKEERAQLRRYKQSQAMKGNQNASKGLSARGLPLAAPKDTIN